MPDQFVLDNFVQGTSQACLVDLTSPTFAGLTGLTALANGALRPQWSVATDSTLPIYYDIYIQEATATGLFLAANFVMAVSGVTQAMVFTLPDGSPLENGATYHVGVRARDGVGNTDSNLVSSSAVSNGVPDNSVLNAIAGIWDQLRASHATAGTFGEALQSTVASRLAAASYTAPDNASITAIKAKTDNLPADPASETTVAAVNTKLGTPETSTVSSDIKVVKNLTIAGL